MATQVSGTIDEVVLDGEYGFDEITVRFKDSKGNLTKKCLVIENNGTIHVYEDDSEIENKSIRLFKKAIKTA